MRQPQKYFGRLSFLILIESVAHQKGTLYERAGKKAEPSMALHLATGGSPQQVVMGDVWIATSIIAIAFFSSVAPAVH